MTPVAPPFEKSRDFRELRILVLRDNWFGCTGMSAFNAALRTGAHVDSVSETDFISPYWRSRRLRLMRRLTLPLAVKEFNESLLTVARQMRPHLFLSIKGTYVRASTLDEIRSLGTTNYCFFPDTSFTANGKEMTDAIVSYDWVFTTKSFGPSDFKKISTRDCCSYLPHAFDPDVHRPQPTDVVRDRMFECDVSFIGTFSPKKLCILEELVLRRPQLNLKVWGNQWEKTPSSSPLKKHLQFAPVLGHGYARAISKSKINLALLREALPGASRDDQITSRTFHIPACRGLLLHPRTQDFLQFFTAGENCFAFDTNDEMISHIDSLLADQKLRLQVAERGYDLVRHSHSWDHRITTILDHYKTHFKANSGSQ